MSLNKKNKTISVIILFCMVFLGIYYLYSHAKTKEISPLSNPTNPIGNSYGVNVLPKNAFLEINDTKYEGEVKEETSIYDFMSKLRKEGKINFVEKNYIGMGKLITEINGVRSDGEKNWIYYVNGIEAQVGVSNYKIKKGDIVSWKYEKYK